MNIIPKEVVELLERLVVAIEELTGRVEALRQEVRKR